MNDASLLKRIPVVHGSIFRFEGQVSVFQPYEGPCYRCLLPEPPPPELAPSCAEAGVLGVLPGIVGSIQALEAIKLILDLGDPLIGRLLAYDALEQSFRAFKVRRDPECPACGAHAAPIVIAEYDEQCLPHAVLADGNSSRTDPGRQRSQLGRRRQLHRRRTASVVGLAHDDREGTREQVTTREQRVGAPAADADASSARARGPRPRRRSNGARRAPRRRVHRRRAAPT